MKYLFLWIIIFACCTPSFAQHNIVRLAEIKDKMGHHDSGYIPNFDGYLDLSYTSDIETIQLRVVYIMDVKIDTNIYRDRVIAEIGARHTKFYSQYLWELSMNHTHRDRRVSYDWMQECRVLFPSIIYTDKQVKSIICHTLLPYSNVLYEYHEIIPLIDWQMSDDCQTILGYTCMSAMCSFRGRSWKVWYTVDIPAAGFWKFDGLPGMILQAESKDGEFLFKAINIDQPNDMITKCEMPTQRLNRIRIRELEQKIYANSMDAFFAETGQDYYVVLYNGRVEYIEYDDLLPIPYNPLEID